MKIELNERESLNRPAWTSTVETGNLHAYKHKHNIVNGKFHLTLNYYEGKHNDN